MSSFWMSKKQPLYAPMLSTFGGGSARGFNPGGGGAPIVGEHVFTGIQDTVWTAPAGVTSVCVVGVGSGGKVANSSNRGGGGGGLAYINNYSVSPGSSYDVRVNSHDGAYGGKNTLFVDTDVLFAEGGKADGSYAGGDFVGDGGGSGGDGGSGRGGGGAGGYNGDGGNGSSGTGSNAATNSGGGGGGGLTGGSYLRGGGGVGLYGIGADGVGFGGSSAGDFPPTQGGSGGAGGWFGAGGNYGGGKALSSAVSGGGNYNGALRIIWGEGRSFPSTNVDEASSFGNISSN